MGGVLCVLIKYLMYFSMDEKKNIYELFHENIFMLSVMPCFVIVCFNPTKNNKLQ